MKAKVSKVSKHIVKHIVKQKQWYRHSVNCPLVESKSGLMNKHIVKHVVKQVHRYRGPTQH